MKTLEVKVLTIVCLCAMCAWALNTTTIDNKTFYQIATCQDMVAFADLVNTQTSSGYGGYGSYGAPEYGNKSANAIVTAAIDMTCTDAFPMIGAADDNRRYVGTFDGQNFPIRGLKLTENKQNVGLFAAIGEGAYIKNMVVQDVEITGTLGNQTDYPSIGGMVGWMHNGTIEGCYVSGTVKGTAEKEAIGGVVGNAWGGTIKDCLSEVTVIGEKNLDYVGGIVGYAKGEGNDNTQAAGVTISDCVFNGDVVANGTGVVIGGIVGTCDKEQFIVNSFYSGTAADYGVGSGANNNIATVETHFTRTGGTNEPVLNSEEIVCRLNGGTWNNNVCSGATSDVWSSGDGISNGAGTFDNNGNAYYTISFSANGGAFAEGATTWKKLSRGTQISSDGISQPTRTNYAFVGWSKNQNASTGDANLGNVEKAATIYAVWNFSVTFNSNGGSDVATKYVATSGNATVTAPANPTKSGYDFEGWYKESGLNNKWNFATDKVTSSITLYAKWTPKKYTFTIENASIASPSIDGKYDYGSQVTLNATVPEHYHFVKWSDGNTDNPRTVTVGETNTYKAVVAIDQFKVTFYDENGTTVLKSETLYDYGTPAANIAKPSNPTKSATAEFSYEFSGWSPALAAVTENVNYVAAYASSRVKYTLTWNFDGGAAAETEGVGYTKAGQVENAATITYPTVSKDKYDFDGWSPAGVTAMPTHNQTFTALWKVKKVEIAVIYGADATKDSIHIMVNATDDESSVVNQIEAALEAKDITPTKESSATTDYTYNGEWVQNTSGEYVAQFDESAREYTVTLNVPDGATVIPAMTKYAAGTATNLPSANLDGWTFVGWVDGSGNSVTQIAADATGDKAYTAVFTKDITVVYGEGAGDKLTVEIELDDNEAEIIAKIEAALEAAGVTPAKESSATTDYTYNGEWGQNTSGEYVAQFDENAREYTVTLNVPDGATVIPAMTKYAAGTAATLPSANLDGWTFSGWVDGSGNSVTQIAADATGDKAYTAVFTKDITVVYGEGAGDKLTVEIELDDNEAEIIAKIEVALEAKDITPTKESSATTDYTYNGEWEQNTSGEYVAQFDESAREYTVTLNVPDGASVSPAMTKYAAGTAATLPSANLDGWTFSGWVDGSGNSVTQIAADATGDKAYTAVFTKDITVVYGEGAGDKLQVEIKLDDSEAEIIAKIEAALEAAGVTPTKSADADSTYAFSGWDVDGNTYTAEFKGTLITETVVVKYGEGAGDRIEVVVPKASDENSRIAIVNDSLQKKGITPAKASDADSTYAFSGWDVDGNTYTAEFKGTLITETLVAQYGEGAGDRIEVVVPKASDENARIAIVNDSLQKKGITPTKSADADSTYAFSGWDVDGNTYTAEFKGTLITETVVVKYGEGAGDRIEVVVPKASDENSRIAIVNDSLQKKGITPTKSADADSTYAFSGWDVDGNTYTAEFKGTLITETVIVKYGENASDTILVIVPVTADSVARVATVNEAFENHDPAIEKPQKTDGSADSTYTFTGFVPDENGVYTPAFTAEEKTVTMVLAYGEGVDERINVVVPVTYDSEKRLNAIDSTLAAQNPPIEIKKINGSEDSTYTYVGWRTRVDKDSNVVLDENGNPVFEPIFEAEVKTTELVVVYGADATKDVVKIQVPVTLRDSAARVQLVTDSLAAWNITPTKPADEDSTYEFTGKWNIDGDVISAEFKSTPKYIEVVVGGDTVKVVVPEDDSGAGSDPSGKISVDVVLVVDGDTVKATVNDGDILDEAAKDAMNGDIPTKAETADSTFEFAGWTPVVDSTGKTVVDENGNVVYEPSFEGEVKKETIAVVTDSGDTIEVEIHVPDTDEKIQQKIVDEFGKDGIVLPTKDETADSTFEFAGWTPVVDSTGKAVVDENGNAVYEPSFDSEVKKAVIAVVADDGDTVEVEIHVPDTDEKVQQKIVDELAAANVPLPTKPQTDEFMYKFEKFVRNDSTGVYEPVFVKVARVYDIDFRLPKTGKLLTVFNGYVYGEFTKLPGAYIENDSTWEFMGWYTEDDGFGEKVKAMKPTDSGDKILYPLFQKEITYEVDGTKGQIIVAYSETAECSIFRALDGVKPADYEKEGLTFTVESWIEGDDGVFRPNFTQGISRVAAAPHFSVFADGRTLSIDGAKVGATIAVFDMRGSLVAKSFVTNATQRIELAKPGSYIVRVNSQTMRVNVR